MCDILRERLATRGLEQVIILQRTRRQINGLPVELDVRNFFVNPDNEELQQIVKAWRFYSKPKKLLAVFQWVNSNINYELDPSEFWQLPFETLARKAGDCDDIADLTANLLLAVGFKYYEVMLNVADTPQGYHCFATLNGKLVDVLFPHLTDVPSNWHVDFSWNSRNAYVKDLNKK